MNDMPDLDPSLAEVGKQISDEMFEAAKAKHFKQLGELSEHLHSMVTLLHDMTDDEQDICRHHWDTLVEAMMLCKVLDRHLCYGLNLPHVHDENES